MSFFYQKVGEVENKHMQSEKLKVISLEDIQKGKFTCGIRRMLKFGVSLSSIVKVPTPAVFTWHVICVKL